MREIRSLEAESVERLYAVFMEAFADYAVPLTWTRAEFDESNARRGIDLSLSLGAYEGERIVGFILNGRGRWLGRAAAYDMGTGVVPDARGSGLAGLMAERLIGFLPGRGIGLYVLEVIRDNAPAVKTYRKAGFETTRLLECPEGEFRDRGRAAPADLDIVDLVGGAAFPREAVAGFRDWEPSWQNSDDSIARTPGKLILLGARRGGRLVGHLVAGASGTIWQLAVAREERRCGLGSALLRELARRVGPRLRYINVQSDDAGTLGLLAGAGIDKGVGQFEMIRRL